MKKKLVFTLLAVASVALTGCLSANDFSNQVTHESETVTQSESEAVMDSESESVVESETVSEIKEPEVKTLTITATGDCTLGKTQEQGYSGSFWAYYDSYGEKYFFDGVRDIFQEDDCTIVNLECVLTNEEKRVEKAFNLKGFPEYTGIMTSSSVEACSTGNNHCWDYGEKSQTDTQEALDAAGIVWAYNEKVGKYTTDDGLVVGVVSANLLSNPDTNMQILKDDIASLKSEGVDLVVACCHWGIERQYYPNDFQVSSARALVDSGADLVIGNHPHVLQGIEVYNGKVICYSLGNFCFGGNRNPSDKDTMIFQQTFTYIDGEMQDDVTANIIPCTLSGHSDHNDFQPTVASGDKKQKIIDLVNGYLANYSSIHFDEEGKLIQE